MPVISSEYKFRFHILKLLYANILTLSYIESAVAHIFFTVGNGYSVDISGNLYRQGEKIRTLDSLYIDSIKKIDAYINEAKISSNINAILEYKKVKLRLETFREYENLFLQELPFHPVNVLYTSWYPPSEYSLIHKILEIPQNSFLFTIMQKWICVCYQTLQFMALQHKTHSDKEAWRNTIEAYYQEFCPQELPKTASEIYFMSRTI